MVDKRLVLQRGGVLPYALHNWQAIQPSIDAHAQQV
jgi:hypothetical protein